MRDENEELIEYLEDDFIDEYDDEDEDENEDSEEIIEEFDNVDNNIKSNIENQSYSPREENIIPQRKNISEDNIQKSSIPKSIPNNGYSNNHVSTPKNQDLTKKNVPSSKGTNGISDALSNRKNNLVQGKEKNDSDSSDKEKDNKKENLEQKINEAKNDAATAAKGAAEIAAGNKVQGAVDIAKVAMKGVKKKIIIYASSFFVGIFVITAVFFAIISPVQEALDKLKEFWDGITEFSEKTNNMYSGLGFKTTEEAFYDELDYIYNNNFGDINLALLMSALYYTETDNDYETDYSKTDEGEEGSLVDNIGDVGASSTDKYTQGMILRAQILANGMTEETDGETVTLQEFLRLYSEQLNSDIEKENNALIGAILSLLNPLGDIKNIYQNIYNIVISPEYETPQHALITALNNSLNRDVLALKTISSVDFRWFNEDETGNKKFLQIYVTMRVKAYEEEKFKQFLATKYIPKMPEFKPYMNNLSGTARDQEIERIIKEIYERESWYTDVYGMVEGNVEDNDSTCIGAIDNEILSELTKPVDVNDSVSFDGEYAYGISNGKLHNGIDLNEKTSGTKEGSSVYAVANGTVLEVDMGVSCNVSDDASCSENGSYVALSHNISINGTSYTFVTLYANLKKGSNSLKVGDKVKKGAKIGEVGKTGEAKIPQLHFSFMKGQKLDSGSSIDPSNLFIKCDTSQLIGDDIPEKIWWFMINSGYSKISTAAAMGNIQWESGGFNPSAIEGGTGIGFGLCQWSYGRRTQLEKYAKSMKTAATDLLIQLQFLKMELDKNSNSKYASWQWAGHERQYNIWLNSNSESSLNSATEAFCFGFERPDRAKAHLSTRQQYAKNIYNKYKNKNAPSSSSVASSSNSIISNAKKVKKYISSNGYTYGALGIAVKNWRNSRKIDCSSYVSAILYEMRDQKFINWLNKNGGGQATSYTFEDNPFGYKVIKRSDVKAGDILVYNGHVEIYAGKENGIIKVYNAGSTNAIRSSDITNSSRSLNSTTIILRP